VAKVEIDGDREMWEIIASDEFFDRDFMEEHFHIMDEISPL